MLEVLSSGAGGNLATPLVRSDLPLGYWEGALNLAVVKAAKAAVLITVADQGRARVGLGWDGRGTLEYLTPSASALPWPKDLVLAAPLKPAQVTWALDRLALDGIDVDALLFTELPVAVGTLGGRGLE